VPFWLTHRHTETESFSPVILLAQPAELNWLLLITYFKDLVVIARSLYWKVRLTVKSVKKPKLLWINDVMKWTKLDKYE